MNSLLIFSAITFLCFFFAMKLKRKVRTARNKMLRLYFLAAGGPAAIASYFSAVNFMGFNVSAIDVGDGLLSFMQSLKHLSLSDVTAQPVQLICGAVFVVGIYIVAASLLKKRF